MTREQKSDLIQYACDLEDKICYKNEEISNLQKSLEYANDEIVSYCNTTIDLQEENKRLHTRIKTIKRRRKAQTAKMRKYREEITNKQNSIVDYKSKIDKAIEYIKEDIYVEPKELYGLVDGEHLLNILKGDKDE